MLPCTIWYHFGPVPYPNHEKSGFTTILQRLRATPPEIVQYSQRLVRFSTGILAVFRVNPFISDLLRLWLLPGLGSIFIIEVCRADILSLAVLI